MILTRCLRQRKRKKPDDSNALGPNKAGSSNCRNAFFDSDVIGHTRTRQPQLLVQHDDNGVSSPSRQNKCFSTTIQQQTQQQPQRPLLRRKCRDATVKWNSGGILARLMSCEDGASEGGGGCDGDKGCGRAGDWPAGLVWALAENTCGDVPLYRQIRLVMRTRSRIRTSAVWGAGDAGAAGLPAEQLLRRA